MGNGQFNFIYEKKCITILANQNPNEPRTRKTIKFMNHNETEIVSIVTTSFITPRRMDIIAIIDRQTPKGSWWNRCR